MLLELLAACPCLARLSLSHCEHLTERGVFYLAMQCTRLAELRLRACWLGEGAVLQALHDCASPVRLLELPSGRLFSRGAGGGELVEEMPSRNSSVGISA